MKEKIIKILEEYGMDTYHYRDEVADEIIENVINQEVERRVEVERIKFLAGWIMRFKLHSDSSSFCNGFRNMEREYDELCSHLTNPGEGDNS